jgi:Cu+-exporting ATPase
VSVNFTSGKARVEYIPTLVSQVDLRKAIATAGFEAVEVGGDGEDAEAKARQIEIDNQRKLLVIGLVFTIPLFILAMGKDFGLFPNVIAQAHWFNWVMWLLWLHRSNFTLGGSIIGGLIRQCVVGRPIWMC